MYVRVNNQILRPPTFIESYESTVTDKKKKLLGVTLKDILVFIVAPVAVLLLINVSKRVS